MHAKIIQHSKPSNQGAPGENFMWFIEFEPQNGTAFNDKIMGWLSSTDMTNELKLKFPNLESAEEFAKANNIDYEIIAANHKKLVKKTYADNFK